MSMKYTYKCPDCGYVAEPEDYETIRDNYRPNYGCVCPSCDHTIQDEDIIPWDDLSEEETEQGGDDEHGRKDEPTS